MVWQEQEGSTGLLEDPNVSHSNDRSILRRPFDVRFWTDSNAHSNAHIRGDCLGSWVGCDEREEDRIAG